MASCKRRGVSDFGDAGYNWAGKPNNGYFFSSSGCCSMDHHTSNCSSLLLKQVVTHSKGEWVKIPLLLYRVGKRSGTTVTTVSIHL